MVVAVAFNVVAIEVSFAGVEVDVVRAEGVGAIEGVDAIDVVAVADRVLSTVDAVVAVAVVRFVEGFLRFLGAGGGGGGSSNSVSSIYKVVFVLSFSFLRGVYKPQKGGAAYLYDNIICSELSIIIFVQYASVRRVLHCLCRWM